MGRPLRVVIAGGGLAGNVLLNHNGCAALADTDPELMAAIRAVGFEARLAGVEAAASLGSYELSHVCQVRNWSARTMAGDVLYHLEDVVRDGRADEPCLVARWDRIHAATRCDDLVEYGAAAPTGSACAL